MRRVGRTVRRIGPLGPRTLITPPLNAASALNLSTPGATASSRIAQSSRADSSTPTTA
jgi:hypothetical protein